jgi:hypothetical protein
MHEHKWMPAGMYAFKDESGGVMYFLIFILCECGELDTKQYDWR